MPLLVMIKLYRQLSCKNEKRFSTIKNVIIRCFLGQSIIIEELPLFFVNEIVLAYVKLAVAVRKIKYFSTIKNICKLGTI